MRFRFLLSLFLGAFIFSGCGMHSNQEGGSSKSSSRFNEALESQPKSSYLSFSSWSTQSSRNCDYSAENSSDLFSLSFDVNTNNAEEFLNLCMRTYRCSAHGSAAISSFAEMRRSFRIAVVEFSTLPDHPADANSGALLGIYLTGGDTVYFQAGFYAGTKTVKACGVLLHELYHFYSTNGRRVTPSLEVEFPAHYYEEWYTAEFQALMNGQRAVGPRYYEGGNRLFTRYTLAADIDAAYGFTTSSSETNRIVSSFAPFPGETRGSVATNP